MIVTVILALSVGCDSGAGSGTRRITSDKTTRAAVDGWSDVGKQFGCVLFSDLDPPDNVASASAKWKGYIESPAGTTVHYKHAVGGMDINGTECSFADGRGIVSSTKERKLTVSQFNIPIRDAEYDTEINRIAAFVQVQRLLRQ